MPCIKVLVVEDEALIRELVADALSEGGFEPVTMGSGEEAIAWAGSGEPDICALVTDVNLGEGKFKGWEVARRLRAMNADLPVVYVSGDSGYEWPVEGVPNSLLIQKPFAAAQVVTAVSQALIIGNGIAPLPAPR